MFEVCLFSVCLFVSIRVYSCLSVSIRVYPCLSCACLFVCIHVYCWWCARTTIPLSFSLGCVLGPCLFVSNRVYFMLMIFRVYLCVCFCVYSCLFVFIVSSIYLFSTSCLVVCNCCRARVYIGLFVFIGVSFLFVLIFLWSISRWMQRSCDSGNRHSLLR